MMVLVLSKESRIIFKLQFGYVDFLNNKIKWYNKNFKFRGKEYQLSITFNKLKTYGHKAQSDYR